MLGYQAGEMLCLFYIVQEHEKGVGDRGKCSKPNFLTVEDLYVILLWITPTGKKTIYMKRESNEFSNIFCQIYANSFHVLAMSKYGNFGVTLGSV